MATRTWVSGVSHADDAGFRTWGSELSAKLADVGLVKTTDTGQINWTTVTRPAATDVAAGYEIWRFNDALQVSAPIFVKLEYGTASAPTIPALWATVGTGSNGSGTLTGSVTQRALCVMNSAVGSSNYPSLLSSAPGFLGLLWKAGSQSGNVGGGFLAIARHANASGVATGDGFMALWGAAVGWSSACPAQCVRTAAPATVFAASNQFALVPGQVVSSAVDSDYQAYAVQGINPRVWMVPTLAVVCLADVPAHSSFQTAMVGSTPRTFVSVGAGFRPVVTGTGPGNINSYGLAMVWEP